MEDKINKLHKRLLRWENSRGESFYDYFAHDYIKHSDWAYWLLGKGHIYRANKILESLDKLGNSYDQVFLFVINPIDYKTDSQETICKIHSENMRLMAEFLCVSDMYNKKVNTFLRNN